MLGTNVDLTGSNLTALGGHSTDDGTWEREGHPSDQVHGLVRDLMTRYSGAGSEGSNATIVGAGAATYFFNTQLLRNVFASNMNVWWQFNKTDKLSSSA